VEVVFTGTRRRPDGKRQVRRRGFTVARSGDLAGLCCNTVLRRPGRRWLVLTAGRPAGGLVVGGVARLRASATESVGHSVGVVAGRAQQRDRLGGRVELVAVVSQFEAVVPHPLCHL
jgi:hypothetical protein